MLLFFKIPFSNKSFRNTFSVSNNLDPDQDRQNVGPDRGSNCSQRLSADDKSHHQEEKLNMALDKTDFSTDNRRTDKSAYWKTIFFISHPKHMLWALKRPSSMRPKTKGKKIIAILPS